MRKSYYLVVFMVLIIVGNLFGCMKNANSPTSPTVASQDDDQNFVVDQLIGAISTWKVKLVSETPADYTVFGTGKSFTSTWTFKNISTSSATIKEARYVSVSYGNRLSTVNTVSVNRTVSPGATFTVSVPMRSPAKCPATAQNHRENWQLIDSKGNTIMIYQSSTFWRIITVKQNSYTYTPPAAKGTIYMVIQYPYQYSPAANLSANVNVKWGSFTKSADISPINGAYCSLFVLSLQHLNADSWPLTVSTDGKFMYGLTPYQGGMPSDSRLKVIDPNCYGSYVRRIAW